MAIIVATSDPSGLLKKIKEGIDNKDIDTWVYDFDGDFTHVPDQWIKKAWLRPKLYPSELRFGILRPKDGKMENHIYGIYHGRFIEMLLTHFTASFQTAIATASKTEPDNF